MSTKPETTFIASIHKFLPKDLYRMKNNNPFTGGVPDCWYSGDSCDLWVEYKFIPRLPSRGNVRPNLSALQLDWLNNRYREGRNVMVIVGTPEGGVIFRCEEWARDISAKEFNTRLVTRHALAQWIEQEVSTGWIKGKSI